MDVALDSARARARLLRVELEMEWEREIDSSASWAGYLAREVEREQRWAMTELAGWHLSRGERDLAMRWLRREARAQQHEDDDEGFSSVTQPRDSPRLRSSLRGLTPSFFLL